MDRSWPSRTHSVPLHARSPALRDIVMRHAPGDGMHTTEIDGLRLHRFSCPVEIGNALYQPSMCLLVQGSKRVLLGETVHVYDTMRHLVASQHLPAAGRVLTASPEVPYLCVELAIRTSDVADLLLEIGHPTAPPDAPPAQGMYTEEAEPHLLEATFRLLGLLDSTRDARALGASVKREIAYRLLTAPSGRRLARIASGNSHDHCMGRVVGSGTGIAGPRDARCLESQFVQSVRRYSHSGWRPKLTTCC